MIRHGFGGDRKVADTVSAACWKLSPRSAGRFRKEPHAPKPAPPRTTPRDRPLRARHPNHAWGLDITDIPTLFRFFSFKLCAVLDLFSRFPLAARLFVKEPSADEIAELFAKAARRHGKPAFLVSDHGSQFTAEILEGVLERLGVQPRFGAIGSSGSIAIVERLWKTLKSSPSLRSLLPFEVERRLELTVTHYAYHRPHQSLGGRSPAEVYFYLPLRYSSRAPRGRPGEAGPEPPVEIAFLDPEDQTLPILIPRAA